MTDRSNRNAKLLAETFHADWTTGRAADFARAAAARARSHRRVRGALSVAGVAALITLAGIVASHERGKIASLKPLVAANRPVATAPPHGYEIISDDELIAQLRDRPLLVVKRENGTREIVLLENE